MNYISLAFMSFALVFVVGTGLWVRQIPKNEQNVIQIQPTVDIEITPTVLVIPSDIQIPTISSSSVSSKTESSVRSNGLFLHIQSPLNGSTINESTTFIEGTVSKDSIITVNDQEIPVDEQGKFSVQVPLEAGENLIVVNADDKNGNTIKQNLFLTH